MSPLLEKNALIWLFQVVLVCQILADDSYLLPDSIFLEYYLLSWVSCRHQIDGFCFLIHSAYLCHLIGELRPLIFRVIIEWMYCSHFLSLCYFLFLIVFWFSLNLSAFFFLSMISQLSLFPPLWFRVWLSLLCLAFCCCWGGWLSISWKDFLSSSTIMDSFAGCSSLGCWRSLLEVELYYLRIFWFTQFPLRNSDDLWFSCDIFSLALPIFFICLVRLVLWL